MSGNVGHALKRSFASVLENDADAPRAPERVLTESFWNPQELVGGSDGMDEDDSPPADIIFLARYVADQGR